MDSQDWEQTILITHLGVFSYRIMLFGLINAGATFQQMIDTILKLKSFEISKFMSMTWSQCRICLLIMLSTFEKLLTMQEAHHESKSSQMLFWLNLKKIPRIHSLLTWNRSRTLPDQSYHWNARSNKYKASPEAHGLHSHPAKVHKHQKNACHFLRKLKMLQKH